MSPDPFFSKQAARRIVIERQGDWWIVSDEGGEFARSNTERGVLPYVQDLLYGPATTFDPTFVGSVDID